MERIHLCKSDYTIRDKKNVIYLKKEGKTWHICPDVFRKDCDMMIFHDIIDFMFYNDPYFDSEHLLSRINDNSHKALSGTTMIGLERLRQIRREGWTCEHDDLANNDEQLVLAAVLYALPEIRRAYECDVRNLWPWDMKWWKPTPEDRIKELTKAGALIAAEIDRLIRLEIKEKEES